MPQYYLLMNGVEWNAMMMTMMMAMIMTMYNNDDVDNANDDPHYELGNQASTQRVLLHGTVGGALHMQTKSESKSKSN